MGGNEKISKNIVSWKMSYVLKKIIKSNENRLLTQVTVLQERLDEREDNFLIVCLCMGGHVSIYSETCFKQPGNGSTKIGFSVQVVA